MQYRYFRFIHKWNTEQENVKKMLCTIVMVP